MILNWYNNYVTDIQPDWQGFYRSKLNKLLLHNQNVVLIHVREHPSANESIQFSWRHLRWKFSFTFTPHACRRNSTHWVELRWTAASSWVMYHTMYLIMSLLNKVVRYTPECSCTSSHRLWAVTNFTKCAPDFTHAHVRVGIDTSASGSRTICIVRLPGQHQLSSSSRVVSIPDLNLAEKSTRTRKI